MYQHLIISYSSCDTRIRKKNTVVEIKLLYHEKRMKEQQKDIQNYYMLSCDSKDFSVMFNNF